MDAHTAIALGRECLWIALLIAAPILGIALVVGLVIALFQAVTSLQEQTLAMVPKLVAIAAALFLLLPWILQRLQEYALQVMGRMAELGSVWA